MGSRGQTTLSDEEVFEERQVYYIQYKRTF
jgi:hypothetical protein